MHGSKKKKRLATMKQMIPLAAFRLRFWKPMAQSQSTSMKLFFYLRSFVAPRNRHLFSPGCRETRLGYASGWMVARLEESDLILLKVKLGHFLCRATPSRGDPCVMVNRILRLRMVLFFLSFFSRSITNALRIEFRAGEIYLVIPALHRSRRNV